jgi:hypothetical protein
MICRRCHGVRWIYDLSQSDETRIREGQTTISRAIIPCPDCIGGTAHCCDGLTAANDPEDKQEGE